MWYWWRLPRVTRFVLYDMYSLRCLFSLLLLTGPPSPPRNLLFNLNDTCLMLEWSPPSDTGGRRDLTYNVQCKRCGPEPGQCQLCEEELRFLPQPLGLTTASVTVMYFSAHANYTFEIESLNGVSDMSSFPRQVAIITVSTNQGGEWELFQNYFPTLWPITFATSKTELHHYVRYYVLHIFGCSLQ